MLTDSEILNIVSQEMSNATGGSENDSLEHQRKAALGAYLGDSPPVPEGRSSVTSTDVADAIEWIMPEIVKAFTQNNEVVTFDAEFPGDETQAELESQFVYDSLMKDNNGFITIHQFVKDALMQKNGFIKCFYSKTKSVISEAFTGLTEAEFMLVVSGKNTEVIEKTEYKDETDSIPLFDIKISRTLEEGKINVCSVPPEEFRCARMHDSVDLSNSRFTSHVTTKTRSDLLLEGFSKDLIDSLPSNDPVDEDKDYRFYMQGEITQPDGDMSSDESNSIIEVAESYLKIDIEKNGIAKLHKITTAGYDAPSHLLSIEPVDEVPFISATAILMSHKLFGLSIYDRLIEIQNQKTQLWRNIFDNMYQQNNQRTIVVENMVNYDDLLISRPGGIVRVKKEGAVTPFPTTPLSSDSYKMMDYLDTVRAGRAGVTPEGPVTDNMIGDRVGSQGVERMLSQKEELVGLMVRVFAETGIKPLCYMIRNLMIRHQDTAIDYVFRGNWVKVDPRSWRKRSKTTVRVGTGSGNRKEQLMILSQLRAEQKEIKQIPGQILVTPETEFKLLKDISKLGGVSDISTYFLDPVSPKGKQNAQQVGQQMAEEKKKQDEQMIAEMQFKAKLAAVEEQKARIQAMNVQLQNEVDRVKNDLKSQEQMSDQQIEFLKQQLAEFEALLEKQQTGEEFQFKYWDRKKYYEMEEKKIAKIGQGNKNG